MGIHFIPQFVSFELIEQKSMGKVGLLIEKRGSSLGCSFQVEYKVFQRSGEDAWVYLGSGRECDFSDKINAVLFESEFRNAPE